MFAFISDILGGLEYVYDLRNTYNIASANMSIASINFTSIWWREAFTSSVVKIIEDLNDANSADFMDFFAPGSDIYSSMPNEDYNAMSGTSMASPHVAGAWAVIRQAFPNATVDEIKNALADSGTLIYDTRDGVGGPVKPRIDISAAINTLSQAE